MANDKKITEVETGAKAKKKNTKTIGWWIGAIVLVLIAITFVLPATIFTGNSSNQNGISFGKYNGKDIEYSYNSDMYFLLNSLYNQYGQGMDLSDMSTSFSLWQQAFRGAAVQAALQDKANKAGVNVSREAVDDYLINNVYVGADGKFDKERYESTGEFDRASFSEFAKRALANSAVLSDMTSVLASDAEKNYIADMSADTTSFTYIVVDSSVYPDEKAVEFFNSNPAPFSQIGLSVIYAYPEEAQTALDELNGGADFAEVAKKYSKDPTTKDNGGKLEPTMYCELQQNLSTEGDADKIFSTAVGSLTEALPMKSGYSVIAKVEAAPSTPDLKDKNVLRKIKSYIALNNSDLITPFIDESASEIEAEAKSDFTYAAVKYDLEINTVEKVPFNAGSSIYYGNVANLDKAGYLASALYYGGDDMYKDLFTTEVGYVTKAYKTGSSSYVIAKVSDKQTDNSNANMVQTFFDYYRESASQNDVAASVTASDKFEDNFMTTFLTNLMGTSVN